MKLVMVTYHFEFNEDVEKILDDCQVLDFVRYSMVEGKDRDGKHFGSKVYPGNSSVVFAQIEDDTVEKLLEDLEKFRSEEKSHRHLTTLVMPVESRLG